MEGDIRSDSSDFSDSSENAVQLQNQGNESKQANGTPKKIAKRSSASPRSKKAS